MATFGELIHGRKPEVAPFIPTDPLKEMFKLLTGEIKNWDQITALSDLYQTYMMGAYNQAIPGFSDIMAQGGEDTAAMLKEAEPLIKGQLPEDVRNQVLRSAAFKSLGAGTLFGPMGGALAARDLGLTSLDLMGRGSQMAEMGGNAAQRWASIAGSMMLDPAKQLMSPQWFAEFIRDQNAARQATKQRRFNIEAAPDPAWADRANLLMGIIGMATGAGGMGGGLKATGSYESVFGGAGGGGMGTDFGKNVVSPGLTGGAPGINYGGYGTSPVNYGFGYNFGQGAAGQETKGVGGWLGSLWGQLTGSNQGSLPNY